MALNIFFDGERLKYPHTGLYHFCLNLGMELTAAAEQDEHLDFFLPRSLHGIFGHQADYVNYKIVNNILLPTGFRFSPDCSRYDVWHMTHQASLFRASNKHCKTLLTVHDLNFLYENNSERRIKKHIAFTQKRIDQADHIVCISKHVANDVSSNLDLKNKPLSIIYNGCRFPETISGKPLYTPSGKFLFTVGTVMAKKNFHTLPQLLRSFDGELLIGGMDHYSYKADVVAAAIAEGVQDRVRFLGPISEGDKNWYFSNCTAFLFPSLAEGFGLPVLEAMYFGKPVFLSRSTSLPEIGGPHAYYFDDFSRLSMEKAFQQGMRHYEESKPMNAITEWAKKFSWRQTAEAYLKIYKQLA